MRKNRIRIHKQTLHMLGDPDFVQILVNPQNQTIAIRCSNSKDYQAQRIKWKVLANNNCCELYSKYLIDALCDTFLHLDNKHAYSITGQLYKKDRLAHFDLKKSVPLGGNMQYE